MTTTPTEPDAGQLCHITTLRLARRVPQVTDLYDPREQWASFLINALKAKELQAKNVNYIVRGEEVVIVDEFTGRTMPGRRWGDGLHQVRTTL